MCMHRRELNGDREWIGDEKCSVINLTGSRNTNPGKSEKKLTAEIDLIKKKSVNDVLKGWMLI